MIYQRLKERVIDPNYCIGCGVCAGVCQTNKIEMKLDHHGFYKPKFNDQECNNCSQCINVCPFYDSDINEDFIGNKRFNKPEIKFNKELGYFSDTYVGHVTDLGARLKSASGGLATNFLKNILNDGLVDYICLVRATDDKDKLFEYCLVNSLEEINSGAGSAYYPIELSNIIDKILKMPGRYGIVGLPCFIKAIEKARHKNKIIDDRIVVTVGLTCGNLFSSHLVTWFSRILGEKKNPQRIIFRDKKDNERAYPFNHRLYYGDREKIIPYGMEGMMTFKNNACNYCDDTFAECADITFMDAWLPKYMSNFRGTSLVILRKGKFDKYLHSNAEMEKIDYQMVIDSQQGTRFNKLVWNPYNFYKARKKSVVYPNKRIAPKKPNYLIRKKIDINNDMAQRGLDLFFDNYDRYCRFINFQKKKRLIISALERFLNRLK